MKRKHLATNAVLWAAAIIASVYVGAPTVLSFILLPCLGVVSLILGAK